MKNRYLGLLLLLFLLPVEVFAACTVSAINMNTTRNGTWTADCFSENRPESYARFYSFTIGSTQKVTIDLESAEDSYMFLLSGSGTTGSVIEFDDDGNDPHARIVRTLAAGSYTIEATTFDPETTGSFEVSVSRETTAPAPCLGPIEFNTDVSGIWNSSCSSESDRYSRYFTFTLLQSQEVTIDLNSSKDTYLLLREGSTTGGNIITTNHNKPFGSGSQIIITLAPGNYTVQATTWVPKTTGEFVVSVNVEIPECDDCPFLINANLNDAWFNTSTNGQGFLIIVFPDKEEMFVAWFTFDVERPPEDVMAILGDPGHRWLTAQGPYIGDTATLKIFVTEGGVFDSATPVATTDQDGDGTMIIEFADCKEGLVEYEITSLDISGEIPIQRIAEDNVAACEEFLRQFWPAP